MMNPEICETERGLKTDVTVRLPKGLHSRPSARLAQTARQFDADIHLISHESEVDAKSMLDILSLAVQSNEGVRILAKGPQAREAIIALRQILLDEAE